MHIINLKVECKDASGDGTTIVCMNSDYVVRITAKDCGSFSNAPVKKLVVRHDKEYTEVPIRDVVEDGVTYLQATLPPLERKDYVDLGICGKLVDDPTVDPIYASTAARFDCDKSILCGTVVLKADPVLTTLNADSNIVYKATDYGADGFSAVSVNVPHKFEEKRIVPLSMSNGDQTVIPSYDSRTMNEVVIKKPDNLNPDNIKRGVDVGGVVGTFGFDDYDGTVVISGGI